MLLARPGWGTLCRVSLRARVRLDDGREVELVSGDVIGRAATAALCLPDGRISEAHAIVSRRAGGLQLLALRGRVTVDGKPRTKVVLEPGERVVLAGFLALEVVAIEQGSHAYGVVALDADGAPDGDAVPLVRAVSLSPASSPRGLFDPDATAHVLGGRDGPRLRVPGEPDLALAPHATFSCGGRRYRLEAAAAPAPEASATTDGGRYDVALRITARFDTVQIVADGGRGVAFDGNAARALTELAEIRQPVAWQSVAATLWGELAEPVARNRWDQLMARIRDKLRLAGMRSDLVRATRSGLVELVLGPDDRLQVRA